MILVWLVVAVSFAYLLILFAVAHYGDRRADQGRSVIANPWTYTLSLALYCTAWTYFGSVRRAASGGMWFLPVYLGPTLAMMLAWLIKAKMIRISRTYRITTIADFIASRYCKSHLMGGLVTVIVVIGIIPYIALQLKAISIGYSVLTGDASHDFVATNTSSWFADNTLYVALTLALFTVLFGARHLDASERHEGMVAAIAFESLVQLLAFLAVGLFVTYGIYDGFGDIFARAAALPELQRLLSLESFSAAGYGGWFALTLLAMLSVIFLPRQFQVMVVENVNEQHLRRAVWLFPAYMQRRRAGRRCLALGCSARTFSGFERSLDGGLRYAVSGGSLLAFRDQFSWSSVPSLVSFSAAVQQAFDAWATIDPVAGFRPALSFAYDSASTVEFVVGGGANFRGAEIDLIPTTDASAWNIGSSSTQVETWVSTDPSKVRLTSGVVNYNHSSAITGADIYINSNPTAVYNLDLFRRLLTHEIGHALGLGDVETSINPGKFIDDNFAGNATAATTLNNSWASLVNPLDPAHSVGLSVFNIGSATSVSGVNLLMESSGLGIAAGNPVTNLVPLTNDEYGTRQFLYPEISPVAEPSTWLQMVAGASLMGWLAVRRRGQQPGRECIPH